MTVKTYKAIDMQEALKMIKRDLGPQAVILSTRKVIEGKRAFGLLGRPVIEVTAAVDGPAIPSDGPSASEHGRPADGSSKVLEGLRAEMEEMRKELARVLQAAQDPARQMKMAVEAELEEIRWWASRMRKENIRSSMGPDSSQADAMLYRLTAHGMRERHAIYIISKAQECMGDSCSAEEFTNRVEGILRRLAKTVDPIGAPKPCGPRILALVGPTGVGKTTTVAKIAARCALEHGKKVALFTNDTYRIAAVEQLRTYARIMGVPLEVILGPEELPKLIQAYSDRDVVLIDTAGRSPVDTAQISELEALLGSEPRIQVLMLLSAATEPVAMERAARRFLPLRPVALIGTKLDEASHLGTLLSISIQMRLPLAFFTTGQRVPEDIRDATKEEIASWVIWGLPLFYPEVSSSAALG